jgi:hypothetical protein
MYADITLETVALDTPNNVAVHVTDAPTRRVSTICSLSKSDMSPTFRFFHMDCHSHTHYVLTWALQSVNKRKNIQCCQLKFFQCSQQKLIIFFNFLGFPLVCPPPI